MPRQPTSEEQRRQGQVLGLRLKTMRGRRPAEEVARRAGVGVDMLRKIEAGVVPTPGFFTVGRIVDAAGGGLDELWRDTTGPGAHP